MLGLAIKRISICRLNPKREPQTGGRSTEMMVAPLRVLCGLEAHNNRRTTHICQPHQPTFRWRNSIERPPFWEGLATLPPASVFLRDKLCSRVQTSPTDLISIEFYRGRQKLAPFCSRYSKGIAVARERSQLSLFSSLHQAGEDAFR